MISIRATGVADAYRLLSGVAHRLRDQTPAWDDVADEVFEIERRFWLTNGDGEWGGPSDATRQRDARGGRDPRMMRVTGQLEKTATVRGASRQRVQVASSYVLIEVTSGLAAIQESRGREVLTTPSDRDVQRFAEHVVDYVLTGARGVA